MKDKIKLAAFLYFITLMLGQLSAQDAVIPGTVRLDATFESISVNYSISDDLNRNSELLIRYREAGAESYKEGAITMRAFEGMMIDGESTNRNFHAGSVMFLNPDTTYELEFDLSDPDGGGSVVSQFVSTKPIPQPREFSNVRYVSPGNGGGNGTEATPFLGLQAAADSAQEGDLFLVAPGTYQAFSLVNSGSAAGPITFKSQAIHEAIIDGQGTDRGVITLADFNTVISHVIIDGFVIQNGEWGIDAQNTQFVTVRNNIIQDVGFGYVNRRENSNERDQYITNNLILGTTAWPQSNIPSERGIDIRGNNNVVSFNTIKNFGDGVSTDGPMYEQSYSLDIHNNDIQNIVDDHIEVDGIVSNARIYANRCFNGRAGVSLAPIYGGPAYIFRNILFNLEISALKMNRGPSGIVAVHNTSASYENVFESPDGWQNTYFRNNVFLASRYCFEFFGLVDDSHDDWDYGAYYSSRGGEAWTEWFKWNNIRYAQVSDLQNSGILQANSIEVAFEDFVSGNLPDVFPTIHEPSDRDFSPVLGSAVIDNGAELKHLNDHFVIDGFPDRGALEFGEAVPQYGHSFDFSSSISFVELNIDIFPNPFQDKISIEGDFSNVGIKVYNAVGRLVHEDQGLTSPIVLNLGGLTQGIYFVNLQNSEADELGVYKIVKQ